MVSWEDFAIAIGGFTPVIFVGAVITTQELTRSSSRRWRGEQEVPRNPVEEAMDRCALSMEPRFRTWSYISAAGQLVHEGNSEGAWRFLHRADKALGLNNSLEVNHPKIAEDYGGDEELWKIRRKIRKAKDQLKRGEMEGAEETITSLDGFFFFHSVRRSVECILGLIEPEFGVA